MKKIYILMQLMVLSFIANAVTVKDSIIYDSNGSGNTGSEFIYNNLNNWWGGSDVNFMLEGWTQTPASVHLDLGAINVEDFDSIIVEYTVDPGFNMYINSFGSSITYDGQNGGFSAEESVDMYDMVNAQQNYVSDFNYQTSTVTLKANPANTDIIVSENKLNIFNLQSIFSEAGVGNNGCYGPDIYIASNCYCGNKYGQGTQESSTCEGNLMNAMPMSSYEIRITNILVTGYTTETITGLDSKYIAGKEVIKVYNVLGEEVDVATKGEMLIVKFSDGTTERKFNLN